MTPIETFSAFSGNKTVMSNSNIVEIVWFFNCWQLFAVKVPHFLKRQQFYNFLMLSISNETNFARDSLWNTWPHPRQCKRKKVIANSHLSWFSFTFFLQMTFMSKCKWTGVELRRSPFVSEGSGFRLFVILSCLFSFFVCRKSNEKPQTIMDTSETFERESEELSVK